MRALVLVDIQNDFLPGGALEVPCGDEVVPVANGLMPRFELVVATQDWHGPRHGSFASAHPGRSVGERISLDGISQILWPDHCVQFTHGAELASELDAGRITRVFRKGMDDRVDSYSGFFDNARRHSTGLDEYLRTERINEVYVIGLATDYCVRATALDAVDLGFATYIIPEGCRGVEMQPGDSRRAISEMCARGVRLVLAAELR